MVEGRYAFTRDHDEIELEPGGFIFIPRGTRHQYRTLDAPARTLILIVPAGLEGFFREMGARIGGGATALEAMTSLAATYDFPSGGLTQSARIDPSRRRDRCAR